MARAFDASQLLRLGSFDRGLECAFAPLLELFIVGKHFGRHSMMIGREIESVRIWLKLWHSAPKILIAIRRAGVQEKRVIDDDAEQALVEKDADSAENRSGRNAAEERQLLGDVTGETFLAPHSGDSSSLIVTDVSACRALRDLDNDPLARCLTQGRKRRGESLHADHDVYTAEGAGVLAASEQRSPC